MKPRKGMSSSKEDLFYLDINHINVNNQINVNNFLIQTDTVYVIN